MRPSAKMAITDPDLHHPLHYLQLSSFHQYLLTSVLIILKTTITDFVWEPTHILVTVYVICNNMIFPKNCNTSWLTFVAAT